MYLNNIVIYNYIQNKILSLKKNILNKNNINNVHYSFLFFKNIFKSYFTKKRKKKLIFYFKNNYYYNFIMKMYIKHFFKNHYEKYFIFNIEKCVSRYLMQNVYCNLNLNYININRYYFSSKLPIISSKMIGDIISHKLIFSYNTMNLNNTLRFIRKWQINNHHAKKKLFHFYKYSKIKLLDHYANKKYPIQGISIECSGTQKKGRRKKKWFYGDYLKTYKFISSKAPNNTTSADIDYFQTHAITSSCSLGIKIWTFYKTHLCNKNGQIVSFLLI